MKHTRKRLIGLFSFVWLFVGLLSSSQGWAAVSTDTAAVSVPAPTMAGQWLTIDDETGQPRGIVAIRETSEGWQGKLVKIYYRAGEGPEDICTKCTDPAHKGQKILGMTILWGMQQLSPYAWGDGSIIDPHNGEIYRCRITLNPDNKTLHVRGYIGISLLGRTQTWTRVDAQ